MLRSEHGEQGPPLAKSPHFKMKIIVNLKLWKPKKFPEEEKRLHMKSLDIVPCTTRKVNVVILLTSFQWFSY